MAREVEGEDAVEVDVLVPDRRDVPHQIIGQVDQTLIGDLLDPQGVPGHDDVGEQGQGAGDRG